MNICPCQYYPYSYPFYRNFRGYEPRSWELYEERFEPAWWERLERQMGFLPGREPLWWEKLEEQYEPRWLQREERRLGIPQPYTSRFGFPKAY
ncbi:hypothetical protein [Desulfitobacterium sp.]|uniref:hypothetical protein n=1 Tax=Desulfitobacterium sp. TaxID=49981 RepID=UPI002BC94EFE|nr:hypothetical protein [Desulfitobacterium sp.]HVJ48315.1 hypothetical protein [Desulfitobacterium sp.]